MKRPTNRVHLISASSLLISALLISASVQAQPQGGREGPRINHEQIVSQLSLDAATEQSLLQLMNKHRTEHQSQRDDDYKDRREMHERHRTEVKALLGEEQFAAFERSMRMQRPERPPEHGAREQSR